MIKTNFQNPVNQGLLARAYSHVKIKKPDPGDAYVEKDSSGQPLYLYFEESYYYEVIKNWISDRKNFVKPNVNNELLDWNEIRHALSDIEIIEEFDKSNCIEYRGATYHPNSLYSNEMLKNILASNPAKTDADEYEMIERDLFMLFPSFMYFSDEFYEDNIISLFYDNLVGEANSFHIKPIIQILKKYNKTIEDIDIFTSGDDLAFYIKYNEKE